MAIKNQTRFLLFITCLGFVAASHAFCFSFGSKGNGRAGDYYANRFPVTGPAYPPYSPYPYSPVMPDARYWQSMPGQVPSGWQGSGQGSQGWINRR